MQEIWRDIKDFENAYQISNYGRVKSLGNKSNHKGEIILKQSNILGYSCVGLQKNNKAKMFKVHRLVTEAFISNHNNYPQVNHINGIKTDNNVNNLEWCNAKQNCQHAFKIGLRKSKKGIDNPRSKKVYQIDPLNNKTINIFNGLREMERETGFSRNNVAKSAKRKGTAYGWKWKINNIH